MRTTTWIRGAACSALLVTSFALGGLTTNAAAAEPLPATGALHATAQGIVSRPPRRPQEVHEVVLKEAAYEPQQTFLGLHPRSYMAMHTSRSPAFGTAAALLARNTVWASSPGPGQQATFHVKVQLTQRTNAFKGFDMAGGVKAVFHAAGSQTSEPGTTKIEELRDGKVTATIVVNDRRPTAGTTPVSSALKRLGNAVTGGNATVTTKDRSALTQILPDDPQDVVPMPDRLRITHPDGRVEELDAKDAATFKRQLVPALQGFTRTTDAPKTVPLGSWRATRLDNVRATYELGEQVLRASATPPTKSIPSPTP